jgi:hypothetical protein
MTSVFRRRALTRPPFPKPPIRRIGGFFVVAHKFTCRLYYIAEERL